MTKLAIDERLRPDEVFAGNRLLSTFAPEARELIEPFGTLVQLSAGEVVLNRGDQVEASLFPIGATMISLAVELAGGRTVEVASIGLRGATPIHCRVPNGFSFRCGRVAGRSGSLASRETIARHY